MRRGTLCSPLVRVSSLVYQQVVALGELSVAVLADELLLRPRRPPRASEEPGVVVRRGVEGGLAQPLPHEEGGADVGEHVLVRRGWSGSRAGPGRGEEAGGQREHLGPRLVRLLLGRGQGRGGGGGGGADGAVRGQVEEGGDGREGGLLPGLLEEVGLLGEDGGVVEVREQHGGRGEAGEDRSEGVGLVHADCGQWLVSHCYCPPGLVLTAASGSGWRGGSQTQWPASGLQWPGSGTGWSAAW